VELALDVPVLSGTLVRLEPLSVDHVPDLAQAAEEDRSTYGFTLVPRAAEVGDYVAAQLERASSGRMIPFARIRIGDNKAVGCTTYWDPRYLDGQTVPFAVEIGWTWLGHSAQRSGINLEAKLLLFRHAFETWGVQRVDLKADVCNDRSRRAIDGLEARFEWVLRSRSLSRDSGEDGLLRDSAMFSVIAPEWPGVEAGLLQRLGRIEPDRVSTTGRGSCDYRKRFW
jgi:N-acetyltransferase